MYTLLYVKYEMQNKYNLFVMKGLIDIQRLSQKASLIHAIEQPLAKRRRIIQSLHESRRKRLQQAQEELNKNDIEPQVIDNDIFVEGHSIEKSRTKIKSTRAREESPEAVQNLQKNPGVGDVDRMVFDKKFKNYLQHKQEFQEKARRRRNAIRQKRRKIKEGVQGEDIDDYYNEDEILSNTGSDYQYKDVEDMQAAYETLATGKRKKKGVQLFFAQKFELAFRFGQFQMILQASEHAEQGLISKEQLLNYLFDEPMVMMLYSINPYLLADEITEYQTQVPSKLSFEEFSSFLLVDREPTYFQYTTQNLEEARKIGRGLKCSPIVGKWIDETGIYEQLMDIFTSVDMFGNGCVEKAILSKKLALQCERKRYLDIEVVEIVNINKLVPLSRLIYELEHELTEKEKITREEFVNFLTHYHRLNTPEKDKLITKLIMAGKYDTSYIYIVSQEVLDFVKEVFEGMEKFAQYFVRKEKFAEKVCKHKKYGRIREKFVRSEGNRYVVKQTVEQTLARMMNQADEYIDIEDILDFFTNRGRPRVVQYKVYLANLERQLAIIEEQERQKMQKLEEGEELSTSSDEQFEQQIRKKRIERKKKKLDDIHKSMNYDRSKKYNVTIPVAFGFDQRDKGKKMSIRERRVKQMLQQKRLKEEESMKPIPPKEVPKHVKENLFERIMKDQQRERLERLERFRLEIMASIVPMSERLTAPKKLHEAPYRKPYEFVARPMPWYCEVNLLDRINKKKQERRERILEEIINRHNDNDLPEGVLRMLERHQEIDKRREAAKKNNTISTATMGDCTFIPKITKGIPDFKTIHQNLGIDLDIARENKKPVFPEPFSFETREERSRTTHDRCIPKMNIGHPLSHSRGYQQPPKTKQIKTTLKHTGLVQKRMQQRQEKQREAQIEERNSQIRKMRQQKFAPQVRKALKRNQNNIMSHSRNQLMERIKQFQRQQKQKKRQYQNQMINIYTKVWNRPLLIEEGGISQGSGSKENNAVNGEDSRKVNKALSKQQKQKNDKQRQKFNKQYEQKRRRAVQQPPGQYLIQGDEQQYEEGEGFPMGDGQVDMLGQYAHEGNLQMGGFDGEEYQYQDDEEDYEYQGVEGGLRTS